MHAIGSDAARKPVSGQILASAKDCEARRESSSGGARLLVSRSRLGTRKLVDVGAITDNSGFLALAPPFSLLSLIS